ncbi:MAG: membrane protein insertion efficiency factor YidD [Antricoccus sp.]
MSNNVPRKSSVLRLIAIAPIRFYQRWISPAFPPSCKYYPCCSEYGARAVLEWGVVRGYALIVWRILRCNPWSAGGVDHVPVHRSKSTPRQNLAPPQLMETHA